MQPVSLPIRDPRLSRAFFALAAAALLIVGVSANNISLEGFGLVLVLLAMLASILLVFFNFVFVINLVVFLVPWQIYLANWSDDSTLTIRLIDILLNCAVVYTVIKAPRALKQLGSKWMLPLLFFCGLAIVFGISRGDLYSVGKFIVDWWPSVAFYWLLMIWSARLNWSKLIRVFLFSYALQAVLGIVETIIGDPAVILSILKSPIAAWFFEPDLLKIRVYAGSLNFIWQGRVFAFGTYLGSTGFGLTVAIASVVAWANMMGQKRLNLSSGFYLAVLLSGACILAMKRSGWVALLAGVLSIVLISFRFHKLSGRKLILFVLAWLIAAGFVYGQRDILLSRMTDQFGWEYGRERTWPAYLNLIVSQPLGYGPNYPQGSYAIGLVGEIDYALGPENTYLHLALTSGILGLGAFLWMIFGAAWQLWQTRRYGNQNEIIAILGGLAAFLVGGMFVIALGDLQNSGAFFLLLAWAHQCVILNKVAAVHARLQPISG